MKFDDMLNILNDVPDYQAFLTVDELKASTRQLADKYPDVREAAMGALIIVGTPKVVARFTDELQHEELERQRGLAVGEDRGINHDLHSEFGFEEPEPKDLYAPTESSLEPA